MVLSANFFYTDKLIHRLSPLSRPTSIKIRKPTKVGFEMIADGFVVSSLYDTMGFRREAMIKLGNKNHKNPK